MSAITKEDLRRLEKELVTGKHSQVALQLQDLKTADISRDLSSRVASLFNRVGLPRRTLNLLKPFVVLERRDLAPGTDEEVLEYALALSLIGATAEAFQRFRNYKGKKNFKFHFYYSASLIAQWQYTEAIPHLQTALECRDAPAYQRLVVQTNLVASLIFDNNLERAQKELDHVMTDVSLEKHSFILGYCMELAAQIQFYLRNFDQCLKFLEKGKDFLVSAPRHHHLVNEKFQILAKFYQEPNSEQARLDLIALRSKAIGIESWETVRDCDLHSAVVTRNEALLQKVYFGTPYDSYRIRALHRYQQPLSLPISYDWAPVPFSGKPSRIFDFKEGLELNSHASLVKQKNLYQLFGVLASDFYLPFRVETLYTKLFPNQHYDPLSSDKRIYVAIERLRNWLKINEIPVTICQKKRGYRIFFNEPYILRMYLSISDDSRESDLAKILSLNEIREGVNISQIMKILNVSRATAQRKLSDFVSRGDLQRIGNGPSTFYRAP